MSKIDWDWAFGSFIQVIVFGLWILNVYSGFTTLQPVFAVQAVVCCIWFIFAPWRVSGYPRFLTGEWRTVPSIYRYILFDRHIGEVARTELLEI
jgi:hypothetical protein